MASIPVYQLGKHLTSVVLTPQTVAANGGLSDGTAVTVTTYIDSLSESLNDQTEEISAVNSTRQHLEKLDSGHEITLSIIKVNNGNDPNPLRTMFLANSVVKIAYTEGTGSSAKTITTYARITNVASGTQGKGKQIASMTLGPVDAGASTYSVS